MKMSGRNKSMMSDDRIIMGICGTVVSATGTSMAHVSINEIQSIVGIVVTIAGFVISVLIPLAMKLVKKIKDAKADGKITKDEIDDIKSTVKEIVDKTTEAADDVSKKDKEK
jgi:predicted membrane-bound spermidine synthase